MMRLSSSHMISCCEDSVNSQLAVSRRLSNPGSKEIFILTKMSLHTNFNTIVSTDVSWVSASEITFAAYYSMKSPGLLGLHSSPCHAASLWTHCLGPQGHLQLLCFPGFGRLPAATMFKNLGQVASKLSIFIWNCSDALIKADSPSFMAFFFILSFFFTEKNLVVLICCQAFLKRELIKDVLV